MLTNEIYIGNMVQGKYGSVSYKNQAKQAAPQGRMDTDRGTHEPIIETEIMGRAAENACRKGKALSIRNNRAVCAEGALCGVRLHAAFLENQGELLSAMP